MTECEAREMFERWRWPDGPKCPRCGKGNPIAYYDARRGTSAYRCLAPCYRIYTVKTDTFMRRSKLPYLTWARAFALLGVIPDMPVCVLRRRLRVDYKSARNVRAAIMATKRQGRSQNGR